MPPLPVSRAPPPMQLRRSTLRCPTGPSKCHSTLLRMRELLITLPRTRLSLAATRRAPPKMIPSPFPSMTLPAT